MKVIRYLSLILILLESTELTHSQWIIQNSGTAADLYCVIFLDSQTGLCAGNNGKVIRTTNGGLYWDPVTINPSFLINNLFFINSQTGFVSCNQFLFYPYSYYIYKTTNSGLNWAVSYNSDSGRTAAICFINANTGFFGASYCDSPSVTKIFRTTNQNQWNLIYTANACAINTMKFIYNNGYWTGASRGNVYKTTDFGSHWTFQNVGYPDKLYDIHMFNKDTVIVCGETGKIFITSNGGINWSPISSGTSYDLVSISFPDVITGYIQAQSNLYLKSTNGGASWTSHNTGNENVMHSIYFTDALTGYTVGDGGTILKTTTGGTIGIKPVSNELPDHFELIQNYPNPFNPQTHIGFRIAEFGFVKLEILDITGREILILVNEYLNPGTYEVDWDATNYASGVYFYILSEVNGNQKDSHETKKMIILK